MVIKLLLEVMLPLFFYVILGYLFNRLFKLHLRTLTTLLVYLFLPVAVFMKIYDSPLSGKVAGGVLFYLVIQFVSMSLLSTLICRWRGIEKSMQGTFANSIALNNSGNLGLPVNALVFKNDPFALSIGVLIVLFQNIMTFTVGVYNAEASVQLKEAILKMLKLPIIYSVVLGFILQIFHVKLNHELVTILNPITESFAPFALITLGAQLAESGKEISWNNLAISNFLRLIGGPLIAFALIKIFGFEGVVAKALFIGSAFPSSRNSALLSFKGPHASFAAQTVITSTILSSLTLPIVIQLASTFF
ncbi:AEC family transporter [Bacillus sp. AFS053548]|uniref:AEC family transporter n=1 Tax=Bacillus sp. AFS053548 TaxID=2033505 RepID=UPI000BFC9B02|nr:AEC family transporter [Bacillus sp. AFS053548]PGM49111.1 transporter [Bacillus sp. AFS053548]